MDLVTALAAQPPDVRATFIDYAVADRRNQLATMRVLLVERYGHAPPLERLAAKDETLAALEALR